MQLITNLRINVKVIAIVFLMLKSLSDATDVGGAKRYSCAILANIVCVNKYSICIFQTLLLDICGVTYVLYLQYWLEGADTDILMHGEG